MEAARTMISAIWDRRAEPAWIFVDDGAVHVGATDDDLERLAAEAGVAKAARRDLPMVMAGGGLGATTVSATLWAAHRAGIEVVATGGIGGVHPGAGDVSADLIEMARTPCALVCSGPKSIVDPVATMERLDELGVAVVGYRCDHLPFFVVRATDIPLEHRADTPERVAGVVRARRDLGVESAVLICQPVPEEHAVPETDVAAAVLACQERADRDGTSGKALTPYLLSCLAERTGGRSLEANLALLEANAGLAAEIATALV
jgi:pseudouridine-5'-phosphate glycosidase